LGPRPRRGRLGAGGVRRDHHRGVPVPSEPGATGPPAAAAAATVAATACPDRPGGRRRPGEGRRPGPPAPSGALPAATLRRTTARIPRATPPGDLSARGAPRRATAGDGPRRAARRTPRRGPRDL